MKDLSSEQRRTCDAVDRLADFVLGLRLEDLPQEVIEQGLKVIRDTLGTMLAGATLPEVKGLVDRVAALGGRGRATLLGRRATAGPHFAALVNGTGAVSLELDEGNQYAVNHPAVHILPAALAMAEERERSGAELLSAFIAGYEVAVRMGRATHLRDAVHPFGTHAMIGTAAAVSKLLDLEVEQTAAALNLAAGLCIASSQTAANSGASVRNLASGLTNHNGLLAPIWVSAGFTGEPGALQVVFGRILGDRFSETDLGEDLGRAFYITRNYFKVHACSRWNHAPIEAMTSLLERVPFEVEDVEEITVWTYDPATRLDWREPTNGYAAKHSIPYNVAVRLVRGTNDLEAYTDEAVSDPRVRALALRVTVKEDPAMTAGLPDVRPASVQVKLRDGRQLTETIESPRGGFDIPLSDEELRIKFERLARMALPDRAVARLASLVTTLPELKNVVSLGPLLQGSAD